MSIGHTEEKQGSRPRARYPICKRTRELEHERSERAVPATVATPAPRVARTIACVLMAACTGLLASQPSRAQEGVRSSTPSTYQERAWTQDPRVVSIDLDWDEDRDYLWTAGETVGITVQFTDNVRVATANGTPTIGVLLGDTQGFASTRKQARYTRTNGRKVVFTYPVTAVDGVVRAIKIPANSMRLNGGAIRNNRGRGASLDHSEKVVSWIMDPLRPKVSVSLIDRNGVAEGENLRFRIRLIHTSGRCRAAAVVMRQQRSGASAGLSKTGTRVLSSSSRAISIGRPMAAPSPCTAACTSML